MAPDSIRHIRQQVDGDEDDCTLAPAELSARHLCEHTSDVDPCAARFRNPLMPTLNARQNCRVRGCHFRFMQQLFLNMLLVETETCLRIYTRRPRAHAMVALPRKQALPVHILHTCNCRSSTCLHRICRSSRCCIGCADERARLRHTCNANGWCLVQASGMAVLCACTALVEHAHMTSRAAQVLWARFLPRRRCR